MAKYVAITAAIRKYASFMCSAVMVLSKSQVILNEFMLLQIGSK